MIELSNLKESRKNIWFEYVQVAIKPNKHLNRSTLSLTRRYDLHLLISPFFVIFRKRDKAFICWNHENICQLRHFSQYGQWCGPKLYKQWQAMSSKLDKWNWSQQNNDKNNGHFVFTTTLVNSLYKRYYCHQESSSIRKV